MSAKVSVELLPKFRRTLPPTFLFLLYKIVKEQTMVKPPSTGTSRHQVQPRKPTARPPGQTVNPFEALLEGSSLAQQSENHLRASFRAHSATASGAPPSLCRYIDPTNQNCQHAFCVFYQKCDTIYPQPRICWTKRRQISRRSVL